ncbi:hypothetical protein FCM35_KLT13370 [Carex littledalei]|uniref:Uncharacterized protein n=1 Tax=Carex littledalei TaxID=544730 RepID=A0A833VF31_9POAL|nr:hypothetical protein FCM35_KLT13370 [Carex littledalei]
MNLSDLTSFNRHVSDLFSDLTSGSSSVLSLTSNLDVEAPRRRETDRKEQYVSVAQVGVQGEVRWEGRDPVIR